MTDKEYQIISLGCYLMGSLFFLVGAIVAIIRLAKNGQ